MRRISKQLVAVCSAAALAGSSSGADPSDEMLAAWVLDALVADPRVAAERVEVEAQAGIVTLRGTVPTLVGKRYGMLSTQKIRGVVEVVDQIEVETASRPDDQIAADVEQRIRATDAIASDGLSVTSRDGTVTLSGPVASWSQRVTAEVLAAEVRGVRAVDNRLLIRIDSARSDAAIGRDVQGALQRDIYLVGLPIRVLVEAGAVKLYGSLGAAYEKTRAGIQAGWVAGIRSVENEIRVERAEQASGPAVPPEPRGDEELARLVREELAQDDRIEAAAIEVSAARGLVRLVGRAASESQRRLAEQSARNVVGVAWVESELDVAAAERPDVEVRVAIGRALAADSALFGSDIAVSVESGIAVLEGDVASGYHRSHAGAIAARTRGVRGVDNRLRPTPVASVADDTLAREVERRLERDWATGGSAQGIQVAVADGVVTLSGKVDRFARRRAAGSIARRTPGARELRNELVVDPYPYPWEEHRNGEGDPPGWDYWFDYPYLPWIA